MIIMLSVMGEVFSATVKVKNTDNMHRVVHMAGPAKLLKIESHLAPCSSFVAHPVVFF